MIYRGDAEKAFKAKAYFCALIARACELSEKVGEREHR